MVSHPYFPPPLPPSLSPSLAFTLSVCLSECLSVCLPPSLYLIKSFLTSITMLSFHERNNCWLGDLWTENPDINKTKTCPNNWDRMESKRREREEVSAERRKSKPHRKKKKRFRTKRLNVYQKMLLKTKTFLISTQCKHDINNKERTNYSRKRETIVRWPEIKNSSSFSFKRSSPKNDKGVKN